MNYTSIWFMLFVIIVFIIYWFFNFKNKTFQNTILLISSYSFYGILDIKFLLILFFITFTSYGYGFIYSNNIQTKKRFTFWTAIILTTSSLAYFKYYNFFVKEISYIFSIAGININLSVANLIVPVGLSFYTFQSLGYIIDVYNERIKPEINIIDYSLFISFFPQLFAGPIGKAKDLLSQFKQYRAFEYKDGMDGLKLVLTGLFKKIVIADRLGLPVDRIFGDYTNNSGSTLLLGAVYYSIQIYADFSGYTDIARGVAKLFGIKLMINFKQPYFSKDIIDFWRRWHISLSNWLRDYLFLPLSFIFYRKIQGIRYSGKTKEHFVYAAAILITWFIAGLWHGASTAFIIWGLLHGISLVLWNNSKKLRARTYKKYNINSNAKSFIIVQTVLTFMLVTFFWIFFRAGDAGIAIDYIIKIFQTNLLSIPNEITFIVYVFIMIVYEIIHRKKDDPILLETIKYKTVRLSLYYIMILLIISYSGNQNKFIYFQF